MQLARSQGESAVYVVDPETSECLYYESILGHPRKKKVGIPREVLASRKEVEIRYDLIDCSIDVCSVEVRFVSFVHTRTVLMAS